MPRRFAHYEEVSARFEAHPHIQRWHRSDESVIGRAQARLYQAPASLLLALAGFTAASRKFCPAGGIGRGG